MKKEKIIAFGIVASVFVCSAELKAWARQPIDLEHCKQTGKSPDTCQREIDAYNDYNFRALLSTASLTLFNKFSPGQRKEAMNYADRNLMSPDAAVAKVAAHD